MLPDLTQWVPAAADVHSEALTLAEPFTRMAGRFAHRPGTVALLSGGDLDSARHHILAMDPWLTLTAHGRQIALTGPDGRCHEFEADPLDTVAAILDRCQLPEGTVGAPVAAGLFGYLAYDLKNHIEQLPCTVVDDHGLPDLFLAAPSVILCQDRQTRETRIHVPTAKPQGKTPGEIIQGFQSDLAAPAYMPAEPPHRRGALDSAFSRSQYMAAVSRIREYITAGDAYQVNMSQRFTTGFVGDPYRLFENLFERNPAPFFAFIQAGDHQVVSTSPERFLLQSGDRVETRPIKGTRPRGATADTDRALRAELRTSVKDDAELSMIVDLLRNDIGRVCAADTVRVARHKRVEAYQNVYHLVSDVEGCLAPGRTGVDLIRATFPGGSITGCPKVRAMEIIDELEPTRRHVYTGAIGYISTHDTMDLSIAIRTAVIHNGRLSFSVGGGIVYDSDPAAEFTETLDKGKTLMDALIPDDGPSGTEPQVWINGRLAPLEDANLPLGSLGTQYGYGFFETLRVDRGKIHRLDAHLERWKRSWQALMNAPLPEMTWETIIHQVITANGLETGRAAVKLLTAHGSATAPPWDHTLAVLARPYSHRLETIGKPGLDLAIYPEARQTPLAAHKTLNYMYYYLAGQWAHENGANEALILNPDGTVSETNTANLLIIDGTSLIQPTSAHVLPGVMTDAVCELARSDGMAVATRPVRPDELNADTQLVATNALMGAVPITAIDGHPLADAADWCHRMNQRLFPG